jgi:hypothetical protein
MAHKASTPQPTRWSVTASRDFVMRATRNRSEVYVHAGRAGTLAWHAVLDGRFPPDYEKPSHLKGKGKTMSRAQCLCGAVAWEIDGPFELMSHCHCARCRKTHGAAFATYVSGPADRFRLQGADNVVRWQSSPGFFRCFCGRCGAVVPGDPFDGKIFVPAGNFGDDPGARPLAHIFVASKAPWYTIGDNLPQHAEYPASS